MNNKVEINEALQAGGKLVEKINYIEDRLSKAKTWGFIDLFSDSGLLTSVFKHKRLHEAQDEINNLKYLIDNFNKELNDVKVDGVLDNVTMDQFTELCDWLFDGLIVDVYTLSKISDSKTQLDNIKY